MADTTVFKRRQFLNTEGEGGAAYIKAHVNEMQTYPDGGGNVDAEFVIADCNRIVSLDFGAYGKDATSNIRQKITKFRRAVVAFEAALLAQLDLLDAL